MSQFISTYILYLQDRGRASRKPQESTINHEIERIEKHSTLLATYNSRYKQYLTTERLRLGKSEATMTGRSNQEAFD